MSKLAHSCQETMDEIERRASDLPEPQSMVVRPMRREEATERRQLRCEHVWVHEITYGPHRAKSKFMRVPARILVYPLILFARLVAHL